MVSVTGPPASPSEGVAMHDTVARPAGNAGNTSPTASTAASRAPTA